MSCEPDPVHSVILPGLPIFLKWPCVGTVARQEQLFLAPPDGQDAPSASFAPQLFAPQAATVSPCDGGEGSCPVTLEPGPRRWPKTGIWPRAIKWLDQTGNTLFQDEYLLFFCKGVFRSVSFFSLSLCGMWDIRGVRGCSSINWLETLQYIIFAFGLLRTVLAYGRSAVYLQACNLGLQ